MFFPRRTLRFDESYFDPEDTSSYLLDDKYGAEILRIKFASSFTDTSLVAFIGWIDVTYASSYVFSKLIPLSSHVWSIISSEFWWDIIYSHILFSSII